MVDLLRFAEFIENKITEVMTGENSWSMLKSPYQVVKFFDLAIQKLQEFAFSMTREISQMKEDN